MDLPAPRAKLYADLKLMGTDADSISLVGQQANEAVDCMMEEGVLPAAPASDVANKVVAEDNGAVEVAEGSVEPPMGGPINTVKMTPAGDGHPAKVSTPTMTVTGSIAEQMRQRARACAFGTIHLKP